VVIPPLNHELKLIHVNGLRLDKKYNIFNVRVKTAVQLAQGYTIWIGSKDFQIAKLPNIDIAPRTFRRQGNKTVKRNRLNMDLKFFRRLHDGFMQVAWMNVITEEVNVNCEPRTIKQCQSASADKN